jgi:hypothetical protein
MLTIENRIDNFYEQTDHAVNEFMEGSDAHLNLILAVTTPINNLALNFAELNDYLVQHLDNLPDDEIIREILPRMRQLNKSCATLVGSIRTSFLYRDVRLALKNYTKQYDHFREIWHDLQNIRLSKDNELDALMAEINQL